MTSICGLKICPHFKFYSANISEIYSLSLFYRRSLNVKQPIPTMSVCRLMHPNIIGIIMDILLRGT
jgi:hypothetical protein